MAFPSSSRSGNRKRKPIPGDFDGTISAIRRRQTQEASTTRSPSAAIPYYDHRTHTETNLDFIRGAPLQGHEIILRQPSQHRAGLGQERQQQHRSQRQPLHRIPQQPQQQPLSYDTALEEVSKMLTLDFWTNDRVKIRAALCKLIKFCRSPTAKQHVAIVEQLGIHVVVLGALQHYRESTCKDIMIFGCGVLSVLLNLSNNYHGSGDSISLSSNSSTHSSVSDYSSFSSNSHIPPLSGSRIPVGLMGGVELALCVLRRHSEDVHLALGGCKLLRSLLQTYDRSANAARLVAADGLNLLCQTMAAVSHDAHLQVAVCSVLGALCRIEDEDYCRLIIFAGGMVRASIAIQSHPLDTELQVVACRLMTQLVQTMASTTNTTSSRSSSRRRVGDDHGRN